MSRLTQALVATACLTVAGGAAAQGAPIKLATIAPEGSSWMVQMRAGAQEIKTRTEGRVTLKFYGGGVMGNDKKVLRKIRIGQLQGGAFTSTALAERYPALNLYGIPMLFRSLAEVDYVRERLDDRLQEGLRDTGYESFGFAEGGFAYLMANTPLRELGDIRGRKIWVPEGDSVSFLAMETLGLSPVVLPLTDVMTGLTDGVAGHRRHLAGGCPGAAVAHQGAVCDRSAGVLSVRVSGHRAAGLRPVAPPRIGPRCGKC